MSKPFEPWAIEVVRAYLVAIKAPTTAREAKGLDKGGLSWFVKTHLCGFSLWERLVDQWFLPIVLAPRTTEELLLRDILCIKKASFDIRLFLENPSLPETWVERSKSRLEGCRQSAIHHCNQLLEKTRRKQT